MGWFILFEWVLNTVNMFIPLVNVILFLVFFKFFSVIASSVCERFLLLFLYLIFVLLIRISLMSGDLSL